MMNDEMGSRVGASAGPWVNEHDEDEKATLAQAERWATLLGAQLSAITPETVREQPPSAWRSGAGDLTPAGTNGLTGAGSSSSAASGAQDAVDQGQNRMVVRVDGGDLGEVALLVDRKDGAIRVTISAADAGAEAALGLERAGLMRALQSHGISVDSVNVVRANNFGTVLAPPRSTPTQRSAEPSDATPSKDDEHARRRAARKLNLVG